MNHFNISPSVYWYFNRPSPSCCEPQHESEASFMVFIMKISFLHSYANKTNFHLKSFALSLAFIMRFKAIQKWPVDIVGF